MLWLKAELDGVLELVPRGRGKNGSSPCTGKVEGAIEVHDLEARGLLS
jgi:hypothetical protein